MALNPCCIDKSNHVEIERRPVGVKDDDGPDSMLVIRACKVCNRKHYTHYANQKFEAGTFKIGSAPAKGD